MDWASYGAGNRNPVVIVEGVKGLDIVNMSVSSGSVVNLDSEGTYDPDGDDLVYKWWVMPESGTYEGDIDVRNQDSPSADVVIPADASGSVVHIICEVSDTGTPMLTSYRRIILDIK
jgi:hypothetical protein